MAYQTTVHTTARVTKPARMVHHQQYSVGETTGGLSVFFTVLCIVDLFGVFPIVALPKAVIACGWYGMPLAALVFAVQVYTATLLGRCWVLARALEPRIADKIRYPYAALAELACGVRTRRLCVFLLDATVFGAGIPNLLFASQSLQLFGKKISDGSVDISFCLWLLVIGLLLCPVMWLGSPKDMKTLAVVSTLVVMAVSACTCACILSDDVSPVPASDRRLASYRPALQDFLVVYGIIAFQFDVHPTLLTIQVDMKDSTKINTAVVAGFLATGSMFCLTSVLAATRYGLDVQSNILQGIPASVPLYLVSLLVTLQLCLSSAVGNSALFQHIEDTLGVPRDFTYKRCITRSAIVAAAVFLGESVPRFDLVMGLVGSTLTGPLMFVFPPIFFIQLSRMKNSPEFIASQAEIDHKDSLTLDPYYQKGSAVPIQNGGSARKQNGVAARKQNGVAAIQNGVAARIQNGVASRIQNGVAERIQNGVAARKQNGVAARIKNGVATGIQNVESLELLVTPGKQFYGYKTFESDYNYRTDRESSLPKCGKVDVFLAIAVMLFGVTATVTSTYYSWSNAINYATFTTPCLLNATAAAKSYFNI